MLLVKLFFVGVGFETHPYKCQRLEFDNKIIYPAH
jgi:hypothetical protein